VRYPPLGVLGCQKVICANNKASLRVVDAGVLLGVNQSLPLVFLEPTLLGVDSLGYLVLAFREYSGHVVANVSGTCHEIHVQREKGLSFHELYNALE
jgi:hypothetical protein